MPVPGEQNRAFCTPNDRDWVKFHGKAGQPVRMESRNLAPDTDTFFELFDASGAKLAQNDDFGGSLASRITFTPEQTGTYFLRIRQLDDASGPVVTYDLTISRRRTT
jgi:hypothetical protein